MKYSGMLITFEGGDGSGKSTHAELFKNYLSGRGLEFFATREPGGTDYSEAVRALSKDVRFSNKSLISELLLFESARADIVEKRVIPAWEEGKVVIMVLGRGMDRKVVESLNMLAAHNLVPDITFYMRISPNDAFARKGGADNDVMETAGLDFHDRVLLGFDTLATENPDRFVILDTTQKMADVFAKIQATFEERWSKKGR